MEKLISKRFKVMVCGEFERTCNFHGLLQLLHRLSDYFDYTPKEQRTFWKESLQDKCVYIDANVSCIII